MDNRNHISKGSAEGLVLLYYRVAAKTKTTALEETEVKLQGVKSCKMEIFC